MGPNILDMIWIMWFISSYDIHLENIPKIGLPAKTPSLKSSISNGFFPWTNIHPLGSTTIYGHLILVGPAGSESHGACQPGAGFDVSTSSRRVLRRLATRKIVKQDQAMWMMINLYETYMIVDDCWWLLMIVYDCWWLFMIVDDCWWFTYIWSMIFAIVDDQWLLMIHLYEKCINH